MLSTKLLDEAIDIQQRSHALLRWLIAQVDGRRITVDQVWGCAADGDGALRWMRRFGACLPSAIRPCPEEEVRFARFFASFLTVSYDIDEQPGSRLASRCGCFCPICVRLVAVSHLRPKRLTATDHRRADRLMAARLIRLGVEDGRVVEEAMADTLVGRDDLRRDAAYAAYGASLIRRLEGQVEGPAILALWRAIAWKPSGSPIHGFTLSSAYVAASEGRLLKALPRITSTADAP